MGAAGAALVAALLCTGCTGLSPPSIVQQPADTVVARGEPVTLSCGVAGDPAPRVEWFRGGTAVVTAREDPASHRILLPASGLFFLRAEHGRAASDSGEYWCRAESSQGAVESRRARLQVTFLDREFLALPSDLSVTLGSAVVLPCRAPRGEPRPDISWWRGGRRVLEGPGVRLQEGSLVLGQVGPAAAGQYTCRADNMAGRRETPPITLGVHEPTRLTVEPETVEALVGSDSLLGCRPAGDPAPSKGPRGDPAPSTRWTRPGGAALPWARARLLEGRGLLITNVHPSDEGTYRCRAGGAEGLLELRVVAPPVLTVSPAPHLQVAEGGEVRLSCLATGRPAPGLVWAKEGVTSVLMPGMSADNVQVTAGGSLLIRDPVRENSGVYTCSAVNRVGGALARAVLAVGHGLPGQEGEEVRRAREVLREQMVRVEGVTARGSSSLLVHYTLLARPACLEGVLVHHRLAGDRYAQFSTVRAGLAGSALLIGLKPATSYDVFLRPYCGLVAGLPTVATAASTGEEEGLGTTLVLVAEMINSTTAFVAWQPSTKRGITGYEVELRNNESSLSTQVSAAVSELYLGLNPADMQQDFTVRVAVLAPSLRGDFSPPAKLVLPLGLPVSVQPGLAEAEDTAWLLLLLGSLALFLLLVASLLFYYRRRVRAEKPGYLPAAVTELDCRGPDCLLWAGSDSGADSSTASQKGLLRPLSPHYRAASYGRPPAPHYRAPGPVQSPYATTDLLHRHRLQAAAPLQLAVAPLLRSSGRGSRRCRSSRSSDNLRDSEDSACYAGVHRRRSNPNLLDLLPPPPVTAPPEEGWERAGRRELERALEQELNCFHETVTQFNQY